MNRSTIADGPFRQSALLLLALAVTSSAGAADAKKSPPAGPARLTSEAWRNVPRTPALPAEIDRLIADALRIQKVPPAPLTSDDQFLRRVTLDLTGQLPMPADIVEFAADRDPNKRAKIIDRLLDSAEFARHWARYWRDVIASRLTDLRGQLLARSFEEWLTGELQANKGWDQVVRAMLTAEGPARPSEPGKNGAAFFLLSRTGADAINDRTAETSRLFLGIQIQCAQCHDHPYASWKREQFHELAGFFARVRERPLREEGRLAGYQLVSLPRGEHQMPGKENPRQGIVTPARFLDGKAPPRGLDDRQRRQALADAVVGPDNYWFAAAHVNRLWGELMGQAFVTPVDDMGPEKETVFPEVLARLAASFQAAGYDVKGLFRTVLNTQTYQRQIRPGESASEHIRFAGAYPARLRADSLWQALEDVLGPLADPRAADRPRPGPGGRYGFRSGLEGMFKQEFAFDPSLPADEVESSVPQALLLMNNPVLHQRLRAQGTNLLARILSAYPKDDDALRMVYLRVLSRKPTEGELEKCRKYIRKVVNRAEAFEDILWALLNSTEFQTRR